MLAQHKALLQRKEKSLCRGRESSGTWRPHLCQPQPLALGNYLSGFFVTGVGSRNPQLTAALERGKKKQNQKKPQPLPNLQEVFEKVKWTWHKRQLKAEKRQLKARFMTAPREVIQLQASGIMVLCKEYGSVWGISWKYNKAKKKKRNEHQIDHQTLQSVSVLTSPWLSKSASHSRLIAMFPP